MPIDWREVPGRYIKDPRLGHRLARNSSAGELTDPVWKLYSLGTDELGLIYNDDPVRDFELSDSSYMRVFLLGGSTLAGLGVNPNSSTITSRLEQYLRPANHKARTVNCGVGAYSSWQQLLYFTMELVEYSPDVVVVMDGWNDFVHSTWGNKGYEGKWIPNTHRSLDDLVALIQTASGELPIVEYLKRRFENIPFVKQLRAQSRYAYNAGVWSDPDFRTWHVKPWAAKTYIRNARSITGSATANGAKVIYLFQPQLLWGNRKRTSHEKAMVTLIHERMPKIPELAPEWFQLAREQFELFRRELHDGENIWIEDASAWLDDETESVYHDYNHYNALGQNHIAERIGEIVLRMTATESAGAACHTGQAQTPG